MKIDKVKTSKQLKILLELIHKSGTYSTADYMSPHYFELWVNSLDKGLPIDELDGEMLMKEANALWKYLNTKKR